MAASKGKWIDTETNSIVNSPPEYGVQLLSPNVDPTPADEDAVQRAELALSAAADDDAVVVTEAVTEAVAPTETVAEADSQPAGNATTEEWRAYAVAQGMSEEDAAAMGRDELRDHFA